MDRIPLKAQEREVLGKKVKKLRDDGFLPAHVFGKGLETEHVTVSTKEFIEVFRKVGETGLIDLRIGAEKVRPVLIREVQHDPIKGEILNIDFYQVNLKEKVKVPVPIILIGEEAESVKMGENVVLQNISEIEVEALPADLIENIEVDITVLKNLDDAITVSQLNFDRDKLTVEVDSEEVVVKLAPAVTEEMKALLEEQEAEAEAALAEQAAEEGTEVKEGEAVAEGEAEAGAQGEGESGEVKTVEDEGFKDQEGPKSE